MQPSSASGPRPGRNDPCPCGSGQKYKKCCGQADRVPAPARAPSPATPDVPQVIQLSALAQRAGRTDLAIEHLQSALVRWPDQVDLLNALGNLLVDSGRAAEAVPFLERALAAQPRDPVVTLCNLGVAQAGLGRWDRVVACFERAAALRPNDAAVLCNLANALLEDSRPADAVARYRQALKLQPALAAVHGNLGHTLLALGQVDDALASYRRQLELQPGQADAISSLLLGLNYSDLEPERIGEAHRRLGRTLEERFLHLRRPHANIPDPARRLRVGFVSSDLRAHSVAFFLEPVLARHDRQAFDFHLYSNHGAADATTARLRSHVDNWRDIHQAHDDAVAELIRHDAIDILIDLNGHTGLNRLAVFARKPAPVQVTWLGYPNTTGLTSIDYRLTDAQADPPGHADELHTERLYRLPRSFLCYAPPPDAPPAARGASSSFASGGESGSGGITFGSFNIRSKIGPRVIAAWSRLLEAVPEARLLLKVRGIDTRHGAAELRAAFASHGIDSQRVEVVGRAEALGDHLRRYAQLDVALDTWPYAGTTTTCDALWMGVPVVTLAGTAHAGRVGASLLHALELDQLIARDVDEYVRIAAQLARDHDTRHALRASLRQRMAASPLTDAEGYTRAFEAGLREIWQRWCAGAAAGPP